MAVANAGSARSSIALGPYRRMAEDDRHEDVGQDGEVTEKSPRSQPRCPALALNVLPQNDELQSESAPTKNCPSKSGHLGRSCPHDPHALTSGSD